MMFSQIATFLYEARCIAEKIVFFAMNEKYSVIFLGDEDFANRTREIKDIILGAEEVFACNGDSVCGISATPFRDRDSKKTVFKTPVVRIIIIQNSSDNTATLSGRQIAWDLVECIKVVVVHDYRRYGKGWEKNIEVRAPFIGTVRDF
jgi:hypothetical protein